MSRKANAPAAPEGKPIGPLVAKFLKEWLPNGKKRSKHTVRSYTGMFKNLLEYMEETCGLAPWQVTFESLDDDALFGFMPWLIGTKEMKKSSANTRLGALKSFAKFVSCTDPAELPFCASVSELEPFKDKEELVKYMSAEGVNAIFLAASSSLRDMTLLETPYASGARASELTALTPRDVTFNDDGTANVYLFGKWSRTRVVKIASGPASLLKQYMRDWGDPGGPLFSNRRGEALTPSGLTHIVEKYAKIAHEANPTEVPCHVHPHMFRHSIATHMLRAGTDITEVRLLLDHSSVVTTMVYAKVDPGAMQNTTSTIEEKLILKIEVKEAKKSELDTWLDGLLNPPRS